MNLVENVLDVVIVIILQDYVSATQDFMVQHVINNLIFFNKQVSP